MCRNSFKVERKEGRGKNARKQKRTNRNNGVSQASAIGYASAASAANLQGNTEPGGGAAAAAMLSAVTAERGKRLQTKAHSRAARRRR